MNHKALHEYIHARLARLYFVFSYLRVFDTANNVDTI